ncbi:AraC family transcriptional regulator [Chryseobacterium sp. NRRL B-14859]|uniref:AraC family transcriptional regulator n=1 Tax=Chryseobacterium sp. NRRL B-14859 TaxID=1562763 RepID=UPI0033918817
MEYKMTIDTSNYHIKGNVDHSGVSERKDSLSDHNGFDITLNNIFLDGIHLKWGHYKSEGIKTYSVSPEKETVVAHFCLRGACVSEPKSNLNVQRGECILFKEEKDEYLFHMDVDHGIGEFFEVSFSPESYAAHYCEDNIADEVLNGKDLFTSLAKDPLMRTIIMEMYQRKDNYSGKLKRLYLESKASELLLTQINCFNKQSKYHRNPKLCKSDIEAIHYVKELISNNFDHTTIPDLALSAGINQTKLKMGFKEIFGETVFGYLSNMRMDKAKELLISTDIPVSEIAYRVGYNYSQHFVKAFKRHFGCTPGEFRK